MKFKKKAEADNFRELMNGVWNGRWKQIKTNDLP